MLPSNSWRPCTKRLTLFLITRAPYTRSFTTRQKADPTKAPIKTKRPAHVGPRDWRRAQKLAAEEQAQLPSTDPPEVTALKVRLLGIAHQPGNNFEVVDQFASDCHALQQAKALLSSTDVKQLLGWSCRALPNTNRQLARNKLLAKDPDFQRVQSTLRLVIDEFLAQYKQGRYNVDPGISALVLSHYRDVGEFEKAYKLWSWLCSMKQQGHQDWRTFAARIAIADSSGEGYEACKSLYEDAVETLGDPLVKYYISDNALLSDPTQPAPRAATQAIPLLKAMFPVRIKYGFWREAYLGLDTILRLDPTQLWRAAKSDVLAQYTAWEAFLIESLGVQSNEPGGLQPSLIISWLSQLVPPVIDSRFYDHLTPSRLYTIACVVLEAVKSRYQAQLTASKGRGVQTNVRRNNDFADLKLLWTCWSGLSRLHGSDDAAQAQDIRNSGLEMVNFMSWILEELECNNSEKFQAWIRHDVNTIAKAKGNPDIKQDVAGLLSKLRERINLFKAVDDEADVMSFQMVPFSSDLFSRDEMFGLYRELGFAGEDDNTAPATDIEASRTTPPPQGNETSPAQFTYETKAGLSFAEARFCSWWTINNLYIAAHAFEKAGCHFPHGDHPMAAECAREHAESLEALSPDSSTEEIRQQQKQKLFDFVRNMRQHRGDFGI